MFAGWIMFSAERPGPATVIRAPVLTAANWHNAMLRSMLQTVAAPVTALRRRSRPAR